MTAPSYEQQLKQRYAGVRARLFKAPHPQRAAAKRPAPVLVYLRADHDQHVRQYRAQMKLRDTSVEPFEYLKAWCTANNADLGVIRSRQNPKRLYEIRRAGIIAIAARYPDLSTIAIGKLFNRDHASVLRTLGRLHRGNGGNKFARKLTPEQVMDIRRLHDAGEGCGQIAARFGISQAVVSRIGHRKAWCKLPEAG